MMTERTRSSTEICELRSANMVEPPDEAPPVRQACSDTKNWSVMLSRPVRISLKTTAMVMSLAMLAGSMGRSASFWKITVPESWSIRMANLACVSNSA
ncbi:hypothetical protein D3C72_2179270 [compost metagenome]